MTTLPLLPMMTNVATMPVAPVGSLTLGLGCSAAPLASWITSMVASLAVHVHSQTSTFII